MLGHIYIDRVNACPHHGFETLTLANFFYDGLTLSMKQLLESMCNRGFLHTPNNEALELLSSIAKLTRGWEESLARETSRPGPHQECKRGLYQVDDNTIIRAMLTRLHRRLDDMTIKKEVNAANEVEN